MSVDSMFSESTVGWGAAEWMVYEKVRGFVADAADADLSAVHPDTDIFRELNVDSLGVALILVNLEEAFNVREPDGVLVIGPSLNTPAAIVGFAMTAMAQMAQAAEP